MKKLCKLNEFKDLLWKGYVPVVTQCWTTLPVQITKKRSEFRPALIQKYRIEVDGDEFFFSETLKSSPDGTLDLSRALALPISLEKLAERVGKLENIVKDLEYALDKIRKI